MNRHLIRHVNREHMKPVIASLNARFVYFGSYLSKSQKPTFHCEQIGEDVDEDLIAIYATFSAKASRTSLHLIKTYADGVVNGIETVEMKLLQQVKY